MSPASPAQSRRPAAILLALALAALAGLSGCGNSRTPLPQSTAVPHMLSYPAAGVSFNVPGTWTVLGQRPPLVSTVSSGPATVALWRFPRRGSLPTDGFELDRARAALIEAARARDSSLRVLAAPLVPLDGHRAIELNALEHPAGRSTQVRSIHLFAYGAEVVLEEYAPPSSFRSLDSTVFSPVIRSLRVFAPA